MMRSVVDDMQDALPIGRLAGIPYQVLVCECGSGSFIVDATGPLAPTLMERRPVVL
jgi:hypothetical protein